MAHNYIANYAICKELYKHAGNEKSGLMMT